MFKYRILILITLLILPLVASCQKESKTEWPNKWNKFIEEPLDKYKPHITVKFKKNINEACEEFIKNEKLWSVSARKRRKLWKDIQAQLKFYTEFKSDIEIEQTQNYKDYKEFLKRGNLTLGKAQEKEKVASMRMVSSSIEVLRQANYDDWKLQSRMDTRGVGDLTWVAAGRRLSENKSDDINRDQKISKELWSSYPTTEAREICSEFGFNN